jgi:hypothetical protein
MMTQSPQCALKSVTSAKAALHHNNGLKLIVNN